MQEIIDIREYYNNINEMDEIINSCLINGHNNKKPSINNNTYLKLTNKLYDLLISIDIDFYLNNNFMRYILFYDDITYIWKYEIIIYLDKEHETHLTHYINMIDKILIENNINIVLKDKKTLKFILDIDNNYYTFVIKNRNNENIYNFFFEINQFEYNIKKKLLVNIFTKKTYLLDDEYIINIKNFDFLNINDIDEKQEKIIKLTKNNPLIILELLELLLNFPFHFNVKELNYYIINLNTILNTNIKYSKYIKHKYNNDDELLLYKEMINFAYNLQENNMFEIYSKYLIEKYENLVNLIFSIKINKNILKEFNVIYLKDFICFLLYQHLIYSKRKLFKLKKNTKEINNDVDLLDTFIEENIINIENNDDDFNLLDKKKFKSLKILKEITKIFVKFENLIKLVPLNSDDQNYIKNFYNFNIVLYAKLIDMLKHHTLKLAYIIKKFYFAPKDLIIKSVNIFNNILSDKSYDKKFIISDNFLVMINSPLLNDYIFKKTSNIPTIKFNFNKNIDYIDIIDYQNVFILFIEFIYKNKKDYSENIFLLEDFFDVVFDSCICEMRSYRILKNEDRRKKEKKLKKIKKEQKNIKYKITNKNTLPTLEENSENNEN
jgi:hypothetical protein